MCRLTSVGSNKFVQNKEAHLVRESYVVIDKSIAVCLSSSLTRSFSGNLSLIIYRLIPSVLLFSSLSARAHLPSLSFPLFFSPLLNPQSVSARFLMSLIRYSLFIYILRAHATFDRSYFATYCVAHYYIIARLYVCTIFLAKCSILTAASTNCFRYLALTFARVYSIFRFLFGSSYLLLTSE